MKRIPKQKIIKISRRVSRSLRLAEDGLCSLAEIAHSLGETETRDALLTELDALAALHGRLDKLVKKHEPQVGPAFGGDGK